MQHSGRTRVTWASPEQQVVQRSHETTDATFAVVAAAVAGLTWTGTRALDIVLEVMPISGTGGG